MPNIHTFENGADRYGLNERFNPVLPKKTGRFGAG
jgi:hypothetical protein